jgi:predicted DNA-binding transcriptional regulator
MLISEKSTLTIGLVITLLSGSAWLTTVWASGEQNKEQIQEIKQFLYSKLERIEMRLERIEERLPRKPGN